MDFDSEKECFHLFMLICHLPAIPIDEAVPRLPLHHRMLGDSLKIQHSSNKHCSLLFKTEICMCESAERTWHLGSFEYEKNSVKQDLYWT